ncbi:hypothetical protein DR950_40515 [Kitasatospora xanthocidica]|uniref:Uncharacterized protein n=1 Tax=Kitasatospora xanthocidica TaxID=83382 RepID=A0A372ZIF5_9ACTN|nr:hypothetical protein DR950_40515 [Kitasatospora xanthocidica]
MSRRPAPVVVSSTASRPLVVRTAARSYGRRGGGGCGASAAPRSERAGTGGDLLGDVQRGAGGRADHAGGAGGHPRGDRLGGAEPDGGRGGDRLPGAAPGGLGADLDPNQRQLARVRADLGDADDAGAVGLVRDAGLVEHRGAERGVGVGRRGGRYGRGRRQAGDPCRRHHHSCDPSAHDTNLLGN